MKVICKECKGGKYLRGNSKNGAIVKCSTCHNRGWVLKKKRGRPRKPTRPYYKDGILAAKVAIYWFTLLGVLAYLV